MSSNLILNIPHASDYIPEDCFPKDSEEFRILKEDQINMVDWYTDELFNKAFSPGFDYGADSGDFGSLPDDDGYPKLWKTLQSDASG